MKRRRGIPEGAPEPLILDLPPLFREIWGAEDAVYRRRLRLKPGTAASRLDLAPARDAWHL